MAKNKQHTDHNPRTEHIGIDRKTAKPHISSKSISEIMDEVSRRHKKSLDRLAE